MMDKYAFIFPGQGSQQVGMLSDYQSEQTVVNTLREASEVLDLDLVALFASGPVDVLNKTENTQPALLAASVALWRLWNEKNGNEKNNSQPAFMAGHSLGEYSALVCAGAMDFSKAVALVRQRGRFMQQAVSPGEGAMAALLGLADEAVIDVCARAAEQEVVEAVNFNSPGQVVIAGHSTAVQRAITLAKESGAKKAILLPVSVPSHCALMKEAAEKLKIELEATEIVSPAIPVIQNVSADVSCEPDTIRHNLVAQLYSPVRWVECVTAIHGVGVAHFIECGPGKVLAGLNKRIMRRVPVTSLDSISSMNELIAGGSS